uniref:Uncharacterized protein n=1 Tax=Meloidogyne enterolobii TaxID=390850 RepID=A0A6V7V4D1_MELEN|nr:unnamed protein product [Meloidogyne enterolobii]
MITIRTMLFLTIFLFIHFISFCDSTLLEECNEVYELDDKYNMNECKCALDANTCSDSLLALQTCRGSVKVLKNTSDCEIINSQCSTAEKNSCLDGVCGCFKAMINCIFQHKCTPINTDKKSRSIGVIAGFSGFIEGNFGKTPTELKKED